MDLIFAEATPPGRGGVSIIRLSGDGARSAAERLAVHAVDGGLRFGIFTPSEAGAFAVAYALFVAVCTYLVCRLIAYTVEVGLTWLFPPALDSVLTAVGMAGIGVINYVRLRRTRKD